MSNRPREDVLRTKSKRHNPSMAKAFQPVKMWAVIKMGKGQSIVQHGVFSTRRDAMWWATVAEQVVPVEVRRLR